MFAGMHWDGWEIFGLIGEGLFFARMIAQWAASERAGKPVIPAIYWYVSLAGALIVAAYAIHIGSVAVLMPQIIGFVFYCRGLQLERLGRRREAERRRPGSGGSGRPWPKISAVVPVHNEEKTLAATLESLAGQDYPGEKPEIIAALNGCVDGSRAAAERYPVRIVEDARSGMSFGKNLGGSAAGGDLLVFVDADSRLPKNGLRLIAEAASGKERCIGTVAGKPDRGGAVVRICFLIANRATRRKRAHAPGGVMFMDRATYADIGGFDETLPQGTSTDGIRRGLRTGAEYVFVDSFRAETSIRRFEKTGVISQMLSWRENHRALSAGDRGKIAGKTYENVRDG